MDRELNSKIVGVSSLINDSNSSVTNDSEVGIPNMYKVLFCIINFLLLQQPEMVFY